MNFRYLFSTALLVVGLLAVPAFISAETISGAVKVADGDTVTVKGIKIRLDGMDAPETDQVCISGAGKNYSCGIASRDALIRLIGGRPVSCAGSETDVYGRRLMTCFDGKTNLNAAMVSAGWALAFRRYSIIYVGEEKQARMSNSGMWDGAFIAPWDWRRRDQDTEILGALVVPLDAQKRLMPQPFKSSSPSTGCQIKGNINRKGNRIYHMPGQQHYNKTRITEKTGERWFCTEEEALAAGWRRALK